jgi:2-keto-3-deoxy-L-rhamnonate aldolase RhmA
MDFPKNVFKQRLAAKEKLIGSWLMAGSSVISEAMGCIGFDYLVLDMEHVAIGMPEALSMLQAIEATGTPAVVRLAWNDMVQIKKILDAGAQTVLVPYVQDTDEAWAPASLSAEGRSRRRRTASREPLGRQLLRSRRRSHGQRPALRALGSVEKIEQIAEVERRRALLADLAASMGLLGDMANAKVRNCSSAAQSIATRSEAGRHVAAGHGEALCHYGSSSLNIDVGMMRRRATDICVVRGERSEDISLPLSSSHASSCNLLVFCQRHLACCWNVAGQLIIPLHST